MRKTSLGYRDGRVYKEGWTASKSIPYYGVVPVCNVAADSELLVPAPAEDVEPTQTQTPAPEAPATAEPSTGDAVGTVLLGDVTGDNKVDLADAQFVLKMALKITTEYDEKVAAAADVDLEKGIQLSDAQYVLKKALMIIDKFPAETEAPTASVAPSEPASEEPTTTPEPSAAPSQEPLVQPQDNASGHIWICLLYTSPSPRD